jgi:hypothetical protein
MGEQTMMRMVSQQEWDLSKLPDAVRRQRLLCPPSAECLISCLMAEAADSAEQGKICLKWEPALDKSGYFRINTQIPVTKNTFDLLFNGRSGYRAQYYLSPEEGVLHNRQIIKGLVTAIKIAYSRMPLQGTPLELIERSLHTPHSKIWVFDEKIAFDSAEECTLNPPRWVKHSATIGRKCPLPDCPKIDL